MPVSPFLSLEITFPSLIYVCAPKLYLVACSSCGCILDFPESLPKRGVNDTVGAVSWVIPLQGHLSHSMFFPPYLQEYSFSDSSQQSFSSILTAEDVTHMPYYSSFLQLHQCTELPAEMGGELYWQASFPPQSTGSGWVGDWFLGMLVAVAPCLIWLNSFLLDSPSDDITPPFQILYPLLSFPFSLTLLSCRRNWFVGGQFQSLALQSPDNNVQPLTSYSTWEEVRLKSGAMHVKVQVFSA